MLDPEEAITLTATVAVSLPLVAEGYFLGRRAPWIARLGISLGRRKDEVRVLGDVGPLDEHDWASFSENPDVLVSSIDRDTLSLVDSSMSSGRRGAATGALRATGVPVTGIVTVERRQGDTVLRWHPVVRLPLLLVVGAVVAVVLWLDDGPSALSLFAPLMIAVYLGMVWWSRKRLDLLFHAVAKRIVEAAGEHDGSKPCCHPPAHRGVDQSQAHGIDGEVEQKRAR